jgi:hypothetical protein
VDVVPEFLFHYRCRADGRLLKLTRGWADVFPFNQRLLRQFFMPIERLPAGENAALWTALVSFKHAGDQLWQQQQRSTALHEQHDRQREANAELARQLEDVRQQLGRVERERDWWQHGYEALVRHQQQLRYLLVDKLNNQARKLAPVHRVSKQMVLFGWEALQRFRRKAG